jgi:4'-phosphopantetheinyl transferase
MLSPDRISVLFADDEALAPGIEAAWLAEVPVPRRRQLEAMPDASERRRSLIASRLLLRGIRQILGDSHVDLSSLRYDKDGAPGLDLPVRFSVSHCPGRVVCALSVHTALGVDVEPLDAAAPGRTGLYLSAQERTVAGDDPRLRLGLWTRKEAVAKAAGRRGLRVLGQISVLSDQAECAGQTWHLAPLDLGPRFVAHLACAAATPLVEVRSHSAESLR